MKSLVFVVAALAFAEPAMGQSPLADAARREAERRKQARSGQVQVLTNDDLLKLPQRSTPAPPPKPATTVTTAGTVTPGEKPADAQAAGGAAAAGAAKDAPPAGARDENYWRTRITTAREAVTRLQIQAEAFESRINALTTDFVNRDDPAQRQQIFEARQKALAEFDRLKTEIATAIKAVADIEEEARRANVPPGWIR